MSFVFKGWVCCGTWGFRATFCDMTEILSETSHGNQPPCYRTKTKFPQPRWAYSPSSWTLSLLERLLHTVHAGCFLDGPSFLVVLETVWKERFSGKVVNNQFGYFWPIPSKRGWGTVCAWLTGPHRLCWNAATDCFCEERDRLSLAECST